MTRALVIAFAAAVFATGCSADVVKPQTPPTRPTPARVAVASASYKPLISPLAGTWYPADADTLRKDVASYLDKAGAPSVTNVQAIIVPHAGYRYSGPTAGYAFKQVAGHKYDRVLVIGPSHYLPLLNSASLPGYNELITPLGHVAIDEAAIDKLKTNPLFTVTPAVDQHEHSVQIEVPLLQQALGGFKLVPIVIGQLDQKTVAAMAKALLQIVDNKTLVVTSSDFTHYGPNYDYVPFKDNFAENLKKLDMTAYDAIQNKSVDAFEAHIQKTGDTICGHYPIEVLLTMLPKDSKAHLLHYQTSGSETGDFTNSVSYLSAAFSGAWPNPATNEAAAPKPSLSQADKARLLKLARGTLKYYLAHHAIPNPQDLGIEVTPAMKAVMGGFVTLEKNHELRGCIGEIEPRRPLFRVVMDHAVDAAVHDPRFPPVTADELPQLQIEISALTPPHPVASYRDIVIGKDGMTLKKGFHQAVFLPQVATEQGWTLEQTLSHLAVKAGLPPDAWKQGASFQVFQAVVFHEGGA